MGTLIAYASKYGCTEKCAKLLAEKLDGEITIIDLKEVRGVDLSEYEKVIIGGSIYIGRIQKEVTEFCSNNLAELKEKKIGFFTCGMQSGNTMEAELNQNFNSALLEIVHAKDCFGGEFTFATMSWIEKLIVKKVAKVTSDQSSISKDAIDKFARKMNSI